MKNINYILGMLVGLLLITSSCQKEYELGELKAPANVTLTYEIVGADAEHPNGDGSGVVNFTATANHAITFNYEFGDGKDNKIAADGKISHLYSINGVNQFNVTVYAVGTGGIYSSKSRVTSIFYGRRWR